MEQDVEACTEAQLIAWQCISNTSRLMGLTLSAFISNNKYFIVVSVLSADLREFLHFFFSCLLLKAVLEINRQHPAFLAPFFHSLSHNPLGLLPFLSSSTRKCCFIFN